MVRVLTALVLAASPGREEPTVDWAAIARNTAAWQAHQRALEAQARTNSFDAELERRFAQAAETDDRAIASDNLEDALALLFRRRAQVERSFEQTEALIATLPHNEPLRARLDAERARYRARQERVTAKLRDAIAGFAADRSWPEVFAGGVRNALGQGERAAVRELRDELNAWQPRTPILGASTLNYVRGELTPAPLPSTQMTPAYLQAAAPGPALEDTTTGREVELSSDVVAQANALETPLAIAEFVRNQCQLDWYLGNLKGSTETLRERRGNDADLAVLLVALLRARDVPARFVSGTIELRVEKLADLLGMVTAAEHDAATPLVLDAPRRNRVLQALSAAGIPFTVVQSGGQASAVRLSHVWVEAWLPYADYRGVGSSLEGKQWVPIEPSIPGGAKYVLSGPAFDPFASFTARTLTDAALIDASTRSPLESYRDTVRAWLATAHPGVTYESTLRSVTPRAEELDVIPGSLPYTVVSVQSESAFLADSQKHRVRLTLSDANGALLETTLPLHRLVGHRSSLMFDPATDADRFLLAAAGSDLYGAPATLLEVVGLVRLDGVEVARTTRAVPLGETLAWTAELLLPNGTSRRIDNEVISGNSIALGFAAPFNRHVEPLSPPPADVDGPAQRFLYGRVAAYANEWTAAEEELAALTGVSLIRPTANVAFVQNQLHVVTTLGVRQRVEFRGVEIDADLRTAVPLEPVVGRGGELLELSGHQGSYLEAKVLADGTGERAISATEVIREAGRRGLTVLRIDSANAASQLPLLTADAEVLRDVTDQVALGREVLIPATPMTIENWEGSGYITRDPLTREAGYLLSGIVSGGTTVVSPRFWLDQDLVAQLSGPTVRPFTTDLTRVARIVALPPVSGRIGVVGQALPNALVVVVTTLEGVPVKGAPVTFRRLVNSIDRPLVTSFLTPGTPAETFSMATDDKGRASARLTLDTQTFRDEGAMAVAMPGTPNVQFAGLNHLTADTCAAPCSPSSTIALATPFEAVAFPDVVSQLLLETGVTDGSPAIDLGSILFSHTADQFDNPVANVPVLWTGAPATGRFFREDSYATSTALLDLSSPLQLVSVAQVSSSFGNARVGWIAGPTAGTYFLNAATPTVSAQMIITITDSADYTLRVNTPLRPLSGIFGTSIPVPLVAEVFHASHSALGTTWTPMTGSEPGITSFKVVAQVRNEAGRELSRSTSSPSDTSPSPASQLRTGSNTVFWPKHEVENGYQDVLITAEVKELGPGPTPSERKVCCVGGWYTVTWSSIPKLTPMRQALGEAPVVASGGVASTDDALAGFLIEQLSSNPTYVRFTEKNKQPGDHLVVIPDATVWKRHPTDPTLIEIPAGGGLQLLASVLDSFGGDLVADVYAIEPTTGAPVLAGTNTIRLRPPDLTIAAKVELQPQLILSNRTYETAARPDAGLPGTQLLPDGGLKALDNALIAQGSILVSLTASGRLEAREGATLISGADVFAGIAGVTEVVADAGVAPEIDPTTRELRFLVAPDLGPRTITFTLTDPAGLRPTQTASAQLKTTVDDMSALPVGQVFVKDVSTTDGHLVKQSEDFRLPGRGPALALSRTYTNRGFTEGTLGQGWSHSFDTEVLENVPTAKATVIGGEGTGQTFQCAAGLTNCRAPAGHHSTLRRDPNDTKYVLFRAKGGTIWRYGPSYLDTSRQLHYPLKSVTDAVGNRLVVEREDGPAPQPIFRIYQAGNARFLQLSHSKPPGAKQPRLTALRLFENPTRPTPLPAAGSGVFLDVCVGYEYDSEARLEFVRRYDGDCGGASALLREEKYRYSTSLQPSQKNNLVEYRDPNGTVTQFEYYTASDPLPGEGAFVFFGDKEERVKAVVEPNGPTQYRTPFTYSLVPGPLAGLGGGSVLQLYSTTVGSPRSGVPATVYFQEAGGTTANVLRPLNATTTATTRVEWDALHLKPLRDEDARGRRTQRSFDALGNTIEVRTATTALPASGAGGATEAVVDASGAAVTEVVQKYSFNLAFAKPTCELDAEGRVTLYEHDPGTGLLLRTTRLATRATRAAVLSPTTDTNTCATIAGQLPTSPDDITTSTRYCQVAGAPCPAGGQPGDVYETVDGEDHITRVLSVDSFGMPKEVEQRATSGAAIVTTTTLRDSRGRVTTTSSSRGAFSESRWDGLDRQTCEAKRNTRGPSPGLLTLRSYHPGGQLENEKRASGTCDAPTVLHTKVTTLDERGRPETVTDTGVNLVPPLVTEFGYDEANNRTTSEDGRGVTTTNSFDFADRVESTTVGVTDTPRFAANGGDSTGVGPFATARFGYDTVGNKVFEEDIHGYRTDFTLDSLYRVVATKLPEVPGPELAFSPEQYETRRGYDLVGNVVREVDGNGNATTREYDFANRVTSATDAVGRTEVSTWDKDGNRRTQENLTGAGTPAVVSHLKRTFTFDELHRPLTTTEFVRSGTSLLTYTRESAYDDLASGHAVASKDARGFVTTTLLDDLERPYQTKVDDGSGLLPRTPRTPDDARAGPALALTTSTEFDALGNASAVVDARGNRTESTFDALGRVVARTDALNVTERWTYNAAGAVTSMTDKRGVVHQTRFDALGREKTSVLFETVSGSGALTTLSRNYFDTPDNGRWRIEETDAASSTTARFMDALGRTVTTRDARNFETQARFDAVTARRSRDAKGFVTEVDTDNVYRPTETREYDVGGNTPTYSKTTSYDDVARTETANDWRGTPTVLERDGLGRLIRRTRGSGALIQTDTSVFNAAGSETLHTDANGHRVEWVYDGAGRKVQETKGLGSTVAATWTTTFDAVGNVTQVKGPRNTGVPFDVRTTYDALNRAVRLEDANAHVTFKAYDSGGLLLCQKTPLGDSSGSYAHGAAVSASQETAAACTGTRVTRWEYEEAGQLTKVTTPLGFETTYVWDATRKRLLAKQDANGHLTTFAYDARHQRTDEFQHLDAHARVTSRASVPLFESPNFSSQTGTLMWRTSYDANGNVETRVDPLGQTSTEAHGLRNRLDSVTYSLHLTPRVLPSLNSESLSYDENGNVTQVTQLKATASGVVTEVTGRTYDTLDRLETETRYDTKLTRYGYDAKGNKTSVTDFENTATVYTFDALDRLETTVTPEGTTTSTYFPDSLPKGTAFFNGLHESRCYDAAGRLLKLTTGRSAAADTCAPTSVVTQYTYSFDAEGNRLTQDEVLTAAGAGSPGTPQRTEYGYDEESRLVGVKYPEGTVALYQLDSVGNRVGERKAPSSAVTALTAAAFLLVPTAALSNDVVASFNRVDTLQTVTDSVQPIRNASFTWDEAGNLKAQQTSLRDRRFDWDIKQTLTRVTDNGIEAGRYDYGSNGLRTKRQTALESVEYVLDGDEVLLEASGAVPSHPATRRYTYGASALAVTDINGTTRTTRALHLDGLGSPGTETSVGAAVTQNRQYDAWGLYRNGTAPTEIQPKLGFTGHQYDVETGLTYARARYYDAEYGRFLSRDSVEGSLNDAPSLHRYAYVRANPLRYTDRHGRFADPVSVGLSLYTSVMGMKCASGDASACGRTSIRENAKTLATDIAAPFRAGANELADQGHPVAAGALASTGDAIGTFASSSATFSYRPDDVAKGVVTLPSRLTEAGAGCDLANPDPIACSHFVGVASETILTAAAIGEVGSTGFKKFQTRSEGFVEVTSKGGHQPGSPELFSFDKPPTGALVGECAGGSCLRRGKCFAAGTLVLTRDGKRPIESISEGDVVFSRSDKTGESGWKRVLQTFETRDRAVIELRLVDEAGSEQRLTTTPNHPFWVEGAGWTKATELKAGMLVPTASRGWLRVDGFTWLQKGATTYNFEVEDWHSYFVGDASVWVHNEGDCPKAEYAPGEKDALIKKWLGIEDPTYSSSEMNALVRERLGLEPKSQIQINNESGLAWEREIVSNELPKTQTAIETQITIKTKGPAGVKVRLDAVGTDSTGAIRLTDGKASPTAGFTPNQVKGYPELEKFGGTVRGKGKGAYPGGTDVPPTKVDVIRKE